jgi:thiamine kinase
VAPAVSRADGGGLIPAEALALVPGAIPGADMHVARLIGGSVNDLWRVTTPSGQFALRLDGAAWRRPGVDRHRESLVHEAAAAAGIAPGIVAVSPHADVWVFEFRNGRSWTPEDYADVAQLLRWSARVVQLHRLPVPAALRTPFAPWQLAHDYAAQAGARGVALPAARRDAALHAIAAAQAVLDRAAQPHVLVHGDATAGNVIDDGALWLIDWEYAQLADPAFDLAVVLTYYPAAVRHRQWLIAAAALGAGAPERLVAAETIHAHLSWLWYAARGEAPAVVAAPEPSTR